MIPLTHDQHAPGDDVYGYEDAGERWLPVHTVETVVSRSHVKLFASTKSTTLILPSVTQLISVISLLSQNKPDLDSPANVDAAKEVRDNYTCKEIRTV